jgi:hypothetical protein
VATADPQPLVAVSVVVIVIVAVAFMVVVVLAAIIVVSNSLALAVATTKFFVVTETEPRARIVHVWSCTTVITRNDTAVDIDNKNFSVWPEPGIRSALEGVFARHQGHRRRQLTLTFNAFATTNAKNKNPEHSTIFHGHYLLPLI